MEPNVCPWLLLLLFYPRFSSNLFLLGGVSVLVRHASPFPASWGTSSRALLSTLPPSFKTCAGYRTKLHLRFFLLQCWPVKKFWDMAFRSSSSMSSKAKVVSPPAFCDPKTWKNRHVKEQEIEQCLYLLMFRSPALYAIKFSYTMFWADHSKRQSRSFKTSENRL